MVRRSAQKDTGAGVNVTTKAETEMQESKSSVRGHILFTFVVALALALAWRLREVLELVYVSALFAVVLTPLVQRIQNIRIGWRGRGWRPGRPVAIVGLIVIVFLVLGLFLLLGLPPVMRDVQRFTQDLPARVPGILAKLKSLPMADKFGVDQMAGKAEGMIASTAQYLLSSAPSLLGGIVDLGTAFILCVYFMMEGDEAYHYFLSFFEADTRTRLGKTLIVAEERISKWLLGQGALMLLLGVASTVVFAILHVRYFVLLGVLMGLFNIIPVLGGLITIILAASVAALDSWGKMGGVLVFYLVYTQVENAYLTPKIMKSSVDLPGLAVLIGLLAGSAIAGIVGALVAVPTAALVAVLVNEYLVVKQSRN
jgi:predicted PurR-regulated permease PerM